MKKIRVLVLALVFMLSLSLSAQAALNWTNLESVQGNIVYGSLVIDSQTVAVTIKNSVSNSFVYTNSARDYWTGTAYMIGTENCRPTSTDLIGLSAGGTVTITFSQAVTNPVIGLISWNGNTVEFGTAIEFLSNGHGYWGSGTPVINSAGTGFYGSGEVHGIVRLNGTFDEISFTNTSEGWHGFTVGAESLPAVPVPAAVWLFGSGLAGLVGLRRKLKK